MKRATTALLIAGVAGLVSLVSPRDLLSQAALTATGDGRGDNPVVGSLPCIVDDELDLKFFNWLGIQRPPGAVQFHAPTLAFVGGSNLGNYVLDAQGVPDGIVNAASGWSAFGSVNAMQVVCDRATAGKSYALACWVPDRFLGGTIQTVSSVGSSTTVIGGRAFSVPFGALASLPGPLAGGTLTVTAADGLESFTVQVDAIGGLVIVDFQP